MRDELGGIQRLVCQKFPNGVIIYGREGGVGAVYRVDSTRKAGYIFDLTFAEANCRRTYMTSQGTWGLADCVQVLALSLYLRHKCKVSETIGVMGYI